MEFNLLLADGQIPVLQLLRHGVKPTVEIEVDERAFAVLQLVERGRFLELATQVGELFVAPDYCSAFVASALSSASWAAFAAAASCFALSSSATGTNTGSWASRSLAA